MSLHLQKLSVSYEYPVLFTTNVFSRENPDLVSAISRREPLRRHRVFVLMDEAVSLAWPSLRDEIRRYADSHRDRLQLAYEPVTVCGGEPVKNDPAIELSWNLLASVCRVE